MGYQGSPEEPKHLKIYGTAPADPGQTIDIKAKSHWSGVVYAPNADITLYAMADVYGSFVSNIFEYKALGNFFYDEDLKIVGVNDEGVRFSIKRWSE